MGLIEKYEHQLTLVERELKEKHIEEFKSYLLGKQATLKDVITDLKG